MYPSISVFCNSPQCPTIYRWSFHGLSLAHSNSRDGLVKFRPLYPNMCEINNSNQIKIKSNCVDPVTLCPSASTTFLVTASMTSCTMVSWSIFHHWLSPRVRETDLWVFRELMDVGEWDGKQRRGRRSCWLYWFFLFQKYTLIFKISVKTLQVHMSINCKQCRIKHFYSPIQIIVISLQCFKLYTCLKNY